MDRKTYYDKNREDTDKVEDRNRSHSYIDDFNKHRKEKGQPLLRRPDAEAGDSRLSGDEAAVERLTSRYIDAKLRHSPGILKHLFHRDVDAVFTEGGRIVIVRIEEKENVEYPYHDILHTILSVSEDLAVVELNEVDQAEHC